MCGSRCRDLLVNPSPHVRYMLFIDYWLFNPKELRVFHVHTSSNIAVANDVQILKHFPSHLLHPRIFMPYRPTLT